MPAIVTVLEAQVPPGEESKLQAAYGETAQGPFPPGLVSSALLRGTADPTQWRIETVWQSHEALAAMRRAGTPRGVQIFQAAGAAPKLSIFEVVAEVSPPRGIT